MLVGGGQLANVLSPVAHDPAEVAGVVQAAHDDAVQVHGLDEVAEQGALQPQHVPPAGRGRVSAFPLPGEDGRGRLAGPPGRLQLGLLCEAPVPLFPALCWCYCPHRAD